MNKQEFAQRFRRLLTFLKWDEEMFALAMGIEKSDVVNLSKGKSLPSYELLNRLFVKVCPEVSANWLLTGHGSFFLNETASAEDVFKELRGISNNIELLMRFHTDLEAFDDVNPIVNSLKSIAAYVRSVDETIENIKEKLDGVE